MNHFIFTNEDPHFLPDDYKVEEEYELPGCSLYAAMVQESTDASLSTPNEDERLTLDERVEEIETDFTARIDTAPTDTKGNFPYNTDNVATIEDVRRVHDVPEDGLTGKDTHVVVMDSGIDPTHPVLPDNPGWVDVTRKQSETPTDEVGHGSASTGQVSQLAPDAEMTALRIFGSSGTTSGQAIMRAFDWLHKNSEDIDLVNMSWGSKRRVPKIDEIHDSLVEKGVRTVVSSGNTGYTSGSPATAEKAFSVGAITEEGQLADFSSYNPHFDNPDVSAIGVDVKLARAEGTSMGTVLDEDWVKGAGTSFSCPEVCGMVAKVLSGNFDTDPKTITETFESASTNIEHTNHEGAGIAHYLPARDSLREVNKNEEDSNGNEEQVNAKVWTIGSNNMVYIKKDLLDSGSYTAKKKEDGSVALTT